MSGTGKEYGVLMRELRKQKEPLRIEYALMKISELGYSCNLEEGNKSNIYLGKIKGYGKHY